MRLRAALALCLLAGFAAPLMAHDIPTDVRVQLFLKPEGRTLRVVTRIPIAAINDLEWPTAGLQLDLARVDPVLQEAAVAWIARRLDLWEGDRRLAGVTVASARVSLPSDLSFASYDGALAHVLGPPLATGTEVFTSQALMDVLLEYPIESDRAQFSIEPRFGLTGLRTDTVVRYLLPGGVERAFQFHDDPGMVRLDPSWIQAARRFVVDGFFHILGGTDHLLFLFCLVIPFRRFRTLVPIVTAFTLAHSVTLIASAYNMAPDALWFPPLVETLIAGSIVYMALENIVSPALGRRWIVAFGFGLVHGFGFSFALRDTLQFAGTHLLTSLLSFNAGVELGQLLVLAVMVPALELVFRLGLAERMGTILLSAFVAHTGWHWTVDRGATLSRYQYQWPAFDAAFFALIIRWLILAVGLGAVAWLGSLTMRALARRVSDTLPTRSS